MNLEEPLKSLVLLLRKEGYNTTCSCGHLPRPYIQMEWYSDSDVTRVYNLLVENKYKDFIIKAFWEYKINKRFLEIIFNPKQKLTSIADIKEI